MTDINKTISDTIKQNKVVLYMKGDRQMPQCGFSAALVGVLNHYGVDFHEVNVMADGDVRQGIKDFSKWPTIPQLYVAGEFVGGCDIVREMASSGELTALFLAKDIPVQNQ